MCVKNEFILYIYKKIFPCLVIPMEELDLIERNEVRILHYENPTRFYVYLREKIRSHKEVKFCFFPDNNIFQKKKQSVVLQNKSKKSKSL